MNLKSYSLTIDLFRRNHILGNWSSGSRMTTTASSGAASIMRQETPGVYVLPEKGIRKVSYGSWRVNENLVVNQIPPRRPNCFEKMESAEVRANKLEAFCCQCG